MQLFQAIFRIPFLKNHFNDGHFDLEDPYLLVGKSLEWFSRHLKLSPSTVGDDLLRNIELIGRLFQKKISDCSQTLDTHKKLLPMSIKISREFLESIRGTEENDEQKQLCLNLLVGLLTNHGLHTSCFLKNSTYSHTIPYAFLVNKMYISLLVDAYAL